jgi:DNA transformation protein
MATKAKSRPATLSRKAPGTAKTKDSSFILFLVEQLGSLGTVRSRAMFGGHGLYLGDAFLAVVDEDRVYFWADETTRAAHTAHGMGPFMPWPGHVMDRYWEVPLDVIEDAPEFVRWGRRALEARAAAETRQKPATKTTPKRAMKTKAKPKRATKAKPKRAIKHVSKPAARPKRKKTR